jgi:hypothetical protein
MALTTTALRDPAELEVLSRRLVPVQLQGECHMSIYKNRVTCVHSGMAAANTFTHTLQCRHGRAFLHARVGAASCRRGLRWP